MPEKRYVGKDPRSKMSGQFSQLPWTVNKGDKGRGDVTGSREKGSGRGSHTLSWTKLEDEGKLQNLAGRKESGASSPKKLTSVGGQRRDEEKITGEREVQKDVDLINKEADEPKESVKVVDGHMNIAMQVARVEAAVEEKQGEGKKKVKCQPSPEIAEGKSQGEMLGDGKKRTRAEIEEMDIDDPRKAKLGKIDGDVATGLCSELMKAGPVNRSYEHQ
jgi:hypothetical protein